MAISLSLISVGTPDGGSLLRKLEQQETRKAIRAAQTLRVFRHE